MREAAPNILFQMLIRGANTVGYTNYPENVVRHFIDQAADAGVDVFRVFDCLNQLNHMTVSIDEVRKKGKLAEACFCYTGDIMDPNRQKYSLKYYTDLAKEMEKAGANIIAIKDMAGLLRITRASRTWISMHSKPSIVTGREYARTMQASIPRCAARTPHSTSMKCLADSSATCASRQPL